jgi:hypothetical protein
MSILVTLSFGRLLFWWAIGYDLQRFTLKPKQSFFNVLQSNTLKKTLFGVFDRKFL